MMQKYFIKNLVLLLSIISILSCTAIKGADELDAGKEYYRKSNYLMAVGAYSQAIKKSPDYWLLYFYRSKAYWKMNKIDLAIIDLNKSLELVPKTGKWYSELPRDEWAEIYVMRGRLYHQKRLYQDASNDFNAALELDSKCYSAYYYRGVTREQIGNYLKAIEDYSKVVDNMSGLLAPFTDSDRILVLLNRANLYRKQDRFNLALADNDKAIEIDGNWKTYLSKGTTLSKMEKFEEAISNYDKSIELNSSADTAYLYRASSRLFTDCDLEKVLFDYHSVLEFTNTDNETKMLVYNQIAWTLATAQDDNIRDAERALMFAKESVKIRKNFRNLDTLAVAYAEYGETEQAINTIEQAIDLCKADDPELLPEIEKHLNNFLHKMPIREDCPGLEIELRQLREWQNES